MLNILNGVDDVMSVVDKRMGVKSEKWIDKFEKECTKKHVETRYFHEDDFDLDDDDPYWDDYEDEDEW